MTDDAGGAVSLRPTHDDDAPFLYSVYASTREDELALLAWTQEQKDAFLTMQFTAQHRHYHTYYPDADYRIVLLRDQPVGRLYVHRGDDAILILDIALLPAYRGSGIGTHLLSGLLAEAAATGMPVRLHVEPWNRARHLYQRLGFTCLAEHGLSWLLEWRPDGSAGPPAQPS